MHLLRHRRPSATHGVILFAFVLLLQSSTRVIAFVARVAACPPVAAGSAAAAAAAAPLSETKTNPLGTQLASTRSTSTTTGTIASKGLTMAAQPSSSAEVIVVGSCNTDLVAYTPRLPGRGESSCLHLTILVLYPHTTAVYVAPRLGRFSKADCSTTKKVVIQNHTSSAISRRYVSSAYLFRTDAILTVEISSIEHRPTT